MNVLLKAPEIMSFGLSGSTARLGSEFWPVSALAAFGMTSMTLMGALDAGRAYRNAIAAPALNPASKERRPAPCSICQLIGLEKPLTVHLPCVSRHSPDPRRLWARIVPSGVLGKGKSCPAWAGERRKPPVD